MARRSTRRGAKGKGKAVLPNQISDAGPVDTPIAETAAQGGFIAGNSAHVSIKESGSVALMTGAATDRDKRQVDRALSETDQGVDNVFDIQEVQPSGLGRPQVTNTAHDAASSSPGPSTIPAKRPQRKQTSLQTAKRAKNDIWTAENVLQNPKSPLIHADFKALFADPEAWNVLDQETKAQLLAMLPEDQRMIVEVDGEKRISEDFLKYDGDWRHYLGRAQEDIVEGRNDPDWLEQAAAASKCRTDGDFDDWKDGEYELFWGTKQKLASNVLTGLASYLKFEDLVKNELIKPGDVFLFQRNIRGALIEKEIKYTGSRDLGKNKVYTCTFPPGVHKFSRGDEDITRDDLIGPESISRAAVVADGRTTDPIPNGNAWKSIRVLRNNQDLGTFWDIRQALHFSIREGDYISCVLGLESHSRRLDKDQAAYVMGYKWLNPYNFLVRLIPLSDIPMQNDILPMHVDMAAEIEKMSLPHGYTVVKCDPRALMTDGIPMPSGVHVANFMTSGPHCFPTEFTRTIATSWLQDGRAWSHGHAHIGVLALNGEPLRRANGRQVDTKKAKNDRDAEFKKSLPTIPASDKPDLTCVTLAPAQVELLVTILRHNAACRTTPPAHLAPPFLCVPRHASAAAAAVPGSGADVGEPSDGALFPGQAACAFPSAPSPFAPSPFFPFHAGPSPETDDYYSASAPRRAPPCPPPLQYPPGFVPAIPGFQEMFPDLCRADPAPNAEGRWERADFEALWVDGDGFDFRMVDPALFLPPGA